MARGESRGKLCSYKRTTVVICSFNIVAALYILQSLYTSLYVYSDNAYSNADKFTQDKINRMEDSIRVRKASEPVELVKMAREIKKELSIEQSVPELSRPLKQLINKEILQKLKGLNANANVSEQREAVESWRQEKIQEVNQLTLGHTTLNSTIPAEEAKKLLGALESDWTVLLEEIGLWMPSEIVHEEHHYKPERELELEDPIIPGRPIPPECHAEIHADYGGVAVRWGLTHHVESTADCCQACLDHAKHAKPGVLKCNIWVYCPSETGCHSPDIYEHKHQECWLKHALLPCPETTKKAERVICYFHPGCVRHADSCLDWQKRETIWGIIAEKPQLNFKDKYSQSYRDSHPTAPVVVPWVSGVIST